MTTEAQSVLDAFNDNPVVPEGVPVDQAALSAALRALADQSKTYQIHSPDNRDPWADEITAITADELLTIADELDNAI